MTDVEIAKHNLDGHSICLCKNGEYFTDDGKGISPMMRFISEGKNLSGYSAADVIVGKAAAMLFVKSGIVSVYAKILSESGKAFLDSHNIPCAYETLTEKIINRSGTDICPMEKTVVEISDVDKAFTALKNKLAEIKKEEHNKNGL